MSRPNVLRSIISLFVLLCMSIPAAGQSILTIPNQQALEALSIEELTSRIRRDKFDLVLPQVMRKYNVDMWIQVMRHGNPDPIAAKLGSDSGVFIFTDRGGDRIERAVLGDTTQFGSAGFGGGQTLRESGVYDFVAEEFSRTEMPGGAPTELTRRYKGVGEYVAEHDPRRIAVNFLDKLGPPVVYEVPRIRSEGMWHTDYKLLLEALGDKYAERVVSAEYLIVDFFATGVPSEIVMFKKIREWIDDVFDSDGNNIVPGETKFSEVETADSGWKPGGNRINDYDYVLRGGELIKIEDGKQSGFPDRRWEFGGFFDVVWAYAYVLREGEKQPPPEINRAWADALKVRKILEDNIKVGPTAGETYELIKRKLDEAGFIHVDRQRIDNDLDPEKTQVSIDLHAGSGINAPRIGPLGPDWQREVKIPLYHHFFFEYFVFIPMPEWGEGKYLNVAFHDGVVVTERGIEYFYPPPTQIRLIGNK